MQYPGSPWQLREALWRWVQGKYQATILEEREGYMQVEILTLSLGFPDDLHIRWFCFQGRTSVEFQSEQRIGL